jgi:glycosyltransferase involved in cell wall biosynthesis
MTGTALRILRKALQEHADVYHFHDPELIPVGLFLRACGKKVIYDIHEDLPRDILDKEYLPLWSRRAVSSTVALFERKTARYFSALIPVTPHIAERFAKANLRVVRVSNFPRLEEMRAREDIPPLQERSFSIAYVGQIAANRGIAQMVEAVGLLPDSLNVRLKLAGKFSPPQLLAKISMVPGWQRVDFLGLLERRQTANLLAQVRAGLVVMHPDSQFPQAYPIKMFEYMAAGLPVIASDFPLWREIISGSACGVLVDPVNPRDLAAAIRYIITCPAEAESMGKRGRAAVEKLYNWRTEEQKLLRLYDELGRVSNNSRHRWTNQN